MRFSDKYRPASLDEVVGQSAIRGLKSLAARPYACCVLLECEHGGVGETSAALAFARDLGCEDEWSGLHVVPCSEFTVDVARRFFEGDGSCPLLRLRPFRGRGWQVLVLEEFDWLPTQTQRFLKVALETRLPDSCIVIATSNGAGRLDAALLQRFRIYQFSAGKQFAEACQAKLLEVWRTEAGNLPVPDEFAFWGNQGGGNFSLRVALDQMQQYLTLRMEELLEVL